MDNDLKNKTTQGFWWKRFLYTVTGANHDFEVGPNWFASVMGTGIIANAAASLPLFADHLRGFALVVWCLASLMLIGLVLATGSFLFRQQNAWKRHFHDPMMAQFYGAPPMAALFFAWRCISASLRCSALWRLCASVWALILVVVAAMSAPMPPGSSRSA